MEKLKKKRPESAGDGGISGKKLKSHGGAAAEEEAELEEFNAILQRLRAGFNWIQAKGGGDSAGKTAVTPPATVATAETEFEVGDFEQFQGGDVKMFAGDGVKSDVVGFDLNVDPVNDQKCD